MITTISSNAGDAVTGERIFPGDPVVDTGIDNFVTPYMSETLTRFVKEETVVWLAEKAGYDVVKRDAGDSGDTKVVDESDAGVGGGTVEAGKAKAGGRKPS